MEATTALCREDPPTFSQDLPPLPGGPKRCQNMTPKPLLTPIAYVPPRVGARVDEG
jgi:hypothetical protein